MLQVKFVQCNVVHFGDSMPLVNVLFYASKWGYRDNELSLLSFSIRWMSQLHVRERLPHCQLIENHFSLDGSERIEGDKKKREKVQFRH